MRRRRETAGFLTVFLRRFFRRAPGCLRFGMRYYRVDWPCRAVAILRHCVRGALCALLRPPPHAGILQNSRRGDLPKCDGFGLPGEKAASKFPTRPMGASDMKSMFGKRMLVGSLALSLVWLGVFQMQAQAAIISTQTAIQQQDRETRIANIRSVLAQDAVHRQLVALGVDPAQASERVSALSDGELLVLEQHLNDLPAGGIDALAVIGIVFLVLLILELVGVTDIFKRI